MTACDACLRRGWLVGRLSAHLELLRVDRRHLREVLALSDEELLVALGGARRRTIAEEQEGLRPSQLAAEVEAAGLAAVCVHDDAYPSSLRDLVDAPPILYVAGAIDRLVAMTGDAQRTPAVAVVGARRASADGLRCARTLARDLSLAGVPVISGMALGVDAAAHRGALEGGARTVAVLGGGADVVYPRSEQRLYRDLVRESVVVSELPPGQPVRKWTFPARNRTIAGLAQLTVVVEAAERSGSLITATCAQDLGREVGAVPGRPTVPGTRGTNGLLRDGCVVIRDAQDALDQLFGAGMRSSAPLLRDTGSLHPELRRLLHDVRDGRETVGALCRRPDDVGRVTAGLGELEFLGHVRRTSEGRYETVS